ncbi:MAG: nucleotide sugar dehydrogenase [Thermoflexales bacterium]|nr:nucleotide sugar dehydrogenase [Thermoflexales bacterium]
MTPDTLSSRISSRTARVAIIGLGYVGLPLAVAFARAGFPVVGIDVDEEKVAALNAGRSYIADVSDEDLRPHVVSGRLRATTDYDALREADAIFICVPTPYDAQRAPDLSYIRAAAEGIRSRLRPGQLVVLQSTTYPGTTEEVVQPILEASGLRAGRDFYLAFSPERIDPGNKQWSAYNTPKVVGGIDPESTRLACELLGQMGAPVHPVSSPRAAEMTKLLENIFRAVNIALVNELALLAERMGIDFWEVIEAAKTKPFGFMPFYPGAGVGGHCIPVDPYYLSWKAREYDFYTKFIELAAEVNQAMPYHAVDLVAEALSQDGLPLKGARVLVLGVAFKPDVDDPRNSPAERVIELLLARGALVRYHDPYIPRFTVGGDVFYRPNCTLESVPLTDEELESADCVVIVTGHRSVDYARVVRWARRVVDCCNATRGVSADRPVVRLGAPFPREVR